MRVAFGMYVALGAIDRRRHIEQGHDRGRFEITRLARLHLAVAGRAQQVRQPAGLEPGAGAHQQLGAAQLRDQARARVDAVRVLHRSGGAERLDRVAAELLHQRLPFRLAGEDAQLRLRRQRGGHGHK